MKFKVGDLIHRSTDTTTRVVGRIIGITQTQYSIQAILLKPKLINVDFDYIDHNFTLDISVVLDEFNKDLKEILNA